MAMGVLEPEPTYVRDIEPLFRRSCMPCHRAGNAGPFPLETYAQVIKNKGLVQTVTLSGLMPPYRGTSDFDLSMPQPRLSDAELVLLQRWFRAGFPKGDGDIVTESEDRVLKAGWTAASPPGVKARAEGGPYWTTVAVPVPEMGLVSGFTLRPRSAQSIRWALVGFASGDTEKPVANGTLGGFADYLGVWAIGHGAWRLPSGYSVKASSRTVLVNLYVVPTGKEEDLSFDLDFYSGEGAKAARWLTITRPVSSIPPKATISVTSDVTLAEAADVLAVVPEARKYASEVELEAVLPDGRTKSLLRVSGWRVEWTGRYLFRSPVRLPKGTRLVGKISYDNDEHDSLNDRRVLRPVAFGPGADQEVFAIKVLVSTVPN